MGIFKFSISRGKTFYSQIPQKGQTNFASKIPSYFILITLWTHTLIGAKRCESAFVSRFFLLKSAIFNILLNNRILPVYPALSLKIQYFVVQQNIEFVCPAYDSLIIQHIKKEPIEKSL